MRMGVSLIFASAPEIGERDETVTTPHSPQVAASKMVANAILIYREASILMDSILLFTSLAMERSDKNNYKGY